MLLDTVDKAITRSTPCVNVELLKRTRTANQPLDSTLCARPEASGISDGWIGTHFRMAQISYRHQGHETQTLPLQ